MSTQGKRDFRPTLHFAPRRGWINDPNGLVYENGIWHLFAQHYPSDTKWGPMHWLHATSNDLLHWTELGIALAPDELGMIFSGNAIIDEGNTSGFGETGIEPMIAMFTHHGACEQQSIAYSVDRVNFTKYSGNPVIPTHGLKDFRDPKPFKNYVDGGWSAIIAAGNHVEFYSSNDFKTWALTGEFGAVENQMGGVFECPDMFRLTAPDGTEYDILTASMTQPIERGGNRTQYFIGHFDGKSFTQTVPTDAPLMLDDGYDNYAAVSFAGAPERTLIGWGTSWSYAAEEPTNEFCGIMTIARHAKLISTSAGPRLACTPILPTGEFVPLPGSGELPGELFALRIESEGAVCAELTNGVESFQFGLNGSNEYYADRTNAGAREFSEVYARELYSVSRSARKLDGQVVLELVFDKCIAELFADDGGCNISSLVYPDKPYTKLKLSAGAKASIRAL